MLCGLQEGGPVGWEPVAWGQCLRYTYTDRLCVVLLMLVPCSVPLLSLCVCVCVQVLTCLLPVWVYSLPGPLPTLQPTPSVAPAWHLPTWQVGGQERGQNKKWCNYITCQHITHVHTYTEQLLQATQIESRAVLPVMKYNLQEHLQSARSSLLLRLLYH